jgi:hypothetical protein
MEAMKTYVFAALLLLTATAPAFAGNVCLRMFDVDGWGSRDAHTLVVNDKWGKKYLLTVAGWCQDLDFSMGISIHSFGGNDMTCIDRGDWIALHGPGVMHSPGARCTITKIEPYTPEMEKAYKDGKEAARAAKQN